MLSMTASAAAAARSMSWMVTQLYSNAVSSPTRGRRSARLFVGTLQPNSGDSGLETKRSALGGAHLSYSKVREAAAAVTHKVKHKIPRRVDASALFTPLCRQTTYRESALARALGSCTQCSAPGAFLGGARPQPQQLVSAVARISARTTHVFFFVFFA